ncbi:MAG: type II toxin-antitoxin system VapC family toxin [Acidobacteriaceae bacterium]|nr:type II toxin-antitoxin system VapC family toxin [Acidobacteriaceae bacterium]
MAFQRENREAVFADTFYWIALTNPNDKHFQAALRFDDLLSQATLYTTEEVLSEVLTFFCFDRRLRKRAIDTIREILLDDEVRIIPQSHQSFLAGFHLYAERPDKGYSLTDCISMHTMRQYGVIAVLTNDRHFEQEGFRAVFREP